MIKSRLLIGKPYNQEIVFPLKPNVSLSNLTVAEKIQLTVSLNANVMPPNVCDTGTLF